MINPFLFFLFCSLVFFAALESFYPLKRHLSFAYCFLSSLVVAVIIGIRWNTGTDWFEYYDLYNGISIDTFTYYVERFQFTYSVLNFTFSKLFLVPYSLYLLFFSLFTSFSFLYFSSRLTRKPSLCLLLFFSQYWLGNIVNGPRRALVWFSIWLLVIHHKKYLRLDSIQKLLVVLFAFFSHASGTVCLCFHVIISFIAKSFHGRTVKILQLFNFAFFLLVLYFSFSTVLSLFTSSSPIVEPLLNRFTLPFVGKLISYTSNPQFAANEDYIQTPFQLFLGIVKACAPPLLMLFIYKFSTAFQSRQHLSASPSPIPTEQATFSYELVAFLIGILLYICLSFSRSLQSVSFVFISFGSIITIQLYQRIKSVAAQFSAFFLLCFLSYVSLFSAVSSGYWSNW